MGVPNIAGAWLSKKGHLVYIITQLDDKFVWRVIHANGVTETGIGCFPKAKEEELSLAVVAQWDFHGGDLRANIRRCTGEVVMVKGKETEILWKDKDHFLRDMSLMSQKTIDKRGVEE